jgi:hypothetical protein
MDCEIGGNDPAPIVADLAMPVSSCIGGRQRTNNE